MRGLRDEALEQRLVHVLRGKDVRKERPSLRRRLSTAKGRIVRENTTSLRYTTEESLTTQNPKRSGF